MSLNRRWKIGIVQVFATSIALVVLLASAGAGFAGTKPNFKRKHRR